MEHIQKFKIIIFLLKQKAQTATQQKSNQTSMNQHGHAFCHILKNRL